MQTRYAQSGDVSIAYRVDGEGPVDVVLVPGIVSHVEAFHDLPGYTPFIRALASIARVITFDKRGNGLSDRVPEAPSLADRMDDVRAVLDAAGSERAVVFGTSEGAPLSLLFAATYPERTRALVLFGAFARILAAPDYSVGLPREAYEAFTAGTVDAWGTGAPLVGIFGPSLANDSVARPIAAKCERASTTPTTLRALWRMNGSIDVRDVLGSIATPTLVMHREGDRVIPSGVARWLAPKIRGAKLVMLPGDDHFAFVGDADRVIDEVGSFLASLGITTMAPTLAAPVRDDKLTDVERLFALASIDQPVEIGRFVVERALGSGGMGSVFLALDKDLGRRVAIKVMAGTDAPSFQRFRREAMAIARLSHPNVVHVYELGLDADAPYIVMEHVEGGAASSLRRVPWRRAAAIVASAARGLGAAHARGIVHRDVKPANLLLLNADADVVKVADFGVAKLSDGEPLTKDDGIVGTVGYLAPEQIACLPVDPRVDVYALGVTFHRLLTGEHPFPGTAAEKITAASRSGVPDPSPSSDAPHALAELVMRMGALLPDDRPADGNVAADAIEAVLSSA